MNDQEFLKAKADEILSDDWGTLTKHSFALKRRDGSWQEQTREVYDRGNGAACLLYNVQQDTVLLVRQFRLPAYLNEHDGFLIEAPAGLLEGLDSAERMRAELEEETGFKVSHLTQVFDAFMSPGSVSERIVCFIGNYTADDQVSDGGGHEDEGEDIEVLHLPLAQALEMMATGEINDAKTIMLLQHLAMKKAAES
ncbi:MAG: NUDIX domain-containing protein [Devosiaceae bacterium]